VPHRSCIVGTNPAAAGRTSRVATVFALLACTRYQHERVAVQLPGRSGPRASLSTKARGRGLCGAAPQEGGLHLGRWRSLPHRESES
jgi:hypothetical protein